MILNKKLEIRYSNMQGTFIRIAMVLERRGYMVESMKMFREETGPIMLLHVSGDASRYRQVFVQLQKLVDIISVQEIKEAIVVADEGLLLLNRREQKRNSLANDAWE